MENLKNDLSQYYNSSKHYLILADNNSIKQYIIEHFPFVKTFFKDITHFGEGVSLQKEKVKNTLLDFYLMTYAKKINCYSCYQHGSGFSKWCAITYNIPYIHKFIN